MSSFHFKLVAGILLGLLLAVATSAMLGRTRETPAPPVSEPRVAVAPEPEPSAPPAPPERISRSKGQTDWAFFFRAGDTLSRMADGAPLGIVARLERSHSFPDGSVGPAYVVRAMDARELVFDADELERSARIEAIRELARPPLGARRK